ncbi:MAG: substrate-binding domain-containing protein [Dehalococcoidia bacterium]|nr:MAG: substrate-binding domain-containing protein [Dehalococcoidia bacterium]
MKKFVTIVLVCFLAVSLTLAGCNSEPVTITNTATVTTAATITNTATVTNTATRTSTTPSDDSSSLAPRGRLQVATTTSLYDTGLWGYLEPMFEEIYDIEVDVLYAGTGIAIEYGKRGDVDVITVHSKNREIAYVEEGYGVERVPFAYNYFLIVGPESDPAGINGMIPEDAFKKLFDTGSGTFVSRGDDSGTHGKEKSIWAAAGYEYSDVQNAGDWYVEGGKGMGPTLLMASEMQGYTITDMGTFLSYKADLDLVPIVDQGSILLNVYSLIPGNPDNVSGVNGEMAQNMVDFLISDEIQQLIGEYGVGEYGMQLFTPCAGNEPTS